MPVIRTSARALLLALVPTAFLQAVLLSLSLWVWEQKSFLGLPGPDGVLALYALQLGIAAGLLFAGHLVLRQFGFYSRWTYSIMGGVSAAVAYVMAARYGILATSPALGTWVSAGVLPCLGGVLSGFLYGQFAGIEVHGPAHTAAFKGRFEGPVRVRTSLGAMLLTALMPAVLVAILAFTTVQVGLTGTGAPTALFVALPAQVFMTVMFATIVPSLIFILVVQHCARALDRKRGLEYAGLGAIVGLLFALVALPFSPFVSVVFLMIPSVACGAIMGAMYRRFAGLEPIPLPEPVIVADVETLVPADDPARRGHSILLNG